MAGVPVVSAFLAERARRRGFIRVLEQGRRVTAVVRKVMVNDGITRELRFVNPVERNGVLQFERQWVIMHEITLAVEGVEFASVTYRPEIISVFQQGASVPVLWHPEWPKLFFPIQDDH